MGTEAHESKVSKFMDTALLRKSFGSRAGGGRRVAKRFLASLTAIATSPRTTERATLYDISTHGARITGQCHPHFNEDVMLSIDTVRAFGLVCWANEHEFAIKFDPVLDKECIDLLLQKVGEAKGISAELKDAQDVWMAGSPG